MFVPFKTIAIPAKLVADPVKLPLFVFIIVLLRVITPSPLCEADKLTSSALLLDVILMPFSVIDPLATKVRLAAPPVVLLILPDAQVIFPVALPEPAVVTVTSSPLLRAD